MTDDSTVEETPVEEQAAPVADPLTNATRYNNGYSIQIDPEPLKRDFEGHPLPPTFTVSVDGGPRREIFREQSQNDVDAIVERWRQLPNAQ